MTVDTDLTDSVPDGAVDTEGVVCVGGVEVVTVTVGVGLLLVRGLAFRACGCLLLLEAAPCLPPSRPPGPLAPLTVCLLSREALPAWTLSSDPNLRSVCWKLA